MAKGKIPGQAEQLELEGRLRASQAVTLEVIESIPAHGPPLGRSWVLNQLNRIKDALDK